MTWANRLRLTVPLLLMAGLSEAGLAKPSFPTDSMEAQAGSTLAVESSDVVPERGLLALFGAGLVGLATLARRRFRSSAAKRESGPAESAAAESRRRRPAA